MVTEFLTVTTVAHLFMVMNHTANESKCYRATLEDGVLPMTAVNVGNQKTLVWRSLMVFSITTTQPLT